MKPTPPMKAEEYYGGLKVGDGSFLTSMVTSVPDYDAESIASPIKIASAVVPFGKIGNFRQFLGQQKSFGRNINWLEGSGLFSRVFSVRGPKPDIDAINQISTILFR